MTPGLQLEEEVKLFASSPALAVSAVKTMSDEGAASSLDRSSSETSLTYSHQESAVEGRKSGKSTVLVALGCVALLALVLLILLLISLTGGEKSGRLAAGDAEEPTDPQFYASRSPPSSSGGGARRPGKPSTTTHRDTTFMESEEPPVTTHQEKFNPPDTSKGTPSTTTETKQPKTKSKEKPKITITTTPKAEITTSASGPCPPSSPLPERLNPPHTLTCILGPDMTENTELPCDGICSLIILDWLPVNKAADLGGPYEANMTRFLQGASSYRNTEFGVAFDSYARIKMKQALADPASSEHLNNLIEKRVTYFGYFNTDIYVFNASEMMELLKVLKTLQLTVGENKPADKKAHTFIASAWRPSTDRVSAEDVASAFKSVLMPDLFISKGHLTVPDIALDHCRILPSTYLKGPKMPKGLEYVYQVTLMTALYHLHEVRKLLPGNTPALSVSVGLAGRVYVTRPYPTSTDNFTLGEPCFPVGNVQQLFSISSICRHGRARESEEFNCLYYADGNTSKAYTGENRKTLSYKVCAGKKNMTSVEYGIAAGNVEYADVSGNCGEASFALLRALRRIIIFFRDNYKSSAHFEKCLEAGDKAGK